MNIDQQVRALVELSVKIGEKPEYVQGGGGNTSIKAASGTMAIKASGCKLSDMTPTYGYTLVDYKKIISYFESVDPASKTDYETGMTEFVQKHTIDRPDVKKMRASVEAPFHSFLQTAVIHTHSVYANILCCAVEGKKYAERIFEADAYVWVPYVNPGFLLSLEIKRAVDQHKALYGCNPKWIFMQNHGLIVSSDEVEDCMISHEQANTMIKDYFSITQAYQKPIIENTGPLQFTSRSAIVNEYVKKADLEFDTLDRLALYPDQLVYINKNVAENPGKITLDENGHVVYNTNQNEASYIDETLCAYLYVMNSIRLLKLTISILNQRQKQFIYGWEVEKYRLSQMEQDN